VNRTDVVLADGIATVTHDGRGYPVGGRAAELVRWITHNATIVNDLSLECLEFHCGERGFTPHWAMRGPKISH
jgi:hypothetical protein